MSYEKIVILIPALNPNNKLVDLVKELNQLGLVNIVVIDDGSDDFHQVIFNELEQYQVKIVHHKHNLGKGVAIRTGIDSVGKQQPQVIGVVTADADGQHTPADILKIAQALSVNNKIILGTRDIFHPSVPLTSKIGNTFSAIYYRLKTGKLLKDTQTGLRGIPAKHFAFALQVEGNRYEYEMRFLEEMSANDMDYLTVDIETIYEQDRVTHFRTIRDSYVIYKPFLKNIGSSLLSAIVDITGFMLLVQGGINIISATIIARMISGLFNFSLNKIWVFDKENSNDTRKEMLKYVVLFIVQMTLSGVLTQMLANSIGSETNLLLSKILVDFSLFLINFLVQRFWVFPANKTIDFQSSHQKNH